MHILLTGGGSGGHVLPLIAVARELKKLAEAQGEQLHLAYLGPTSFGRDLLELEHIRVYCVNAAKWRRYASVLNALDLAKIPFSFFVALWKLFWVMPDVIFSKGGYGSLPALWVSRIYRIPVVIHDSDAVPGLASRYAGKFAKKIYMAFAGVEKYFPKKDIEVVGVPVRAELAAYTPEEGRKILGCQRQKPLLFITGGSQGAQKINEIVVNTLPHLLERYEVIHQCGNANEEEVGELVKKEYKAELLRGYHLFGLLDEKMLSAAYAASDVVISRAGASNIFEIAQAERPSVIIPISSSANNHQFENASAYAAAGACVMLDEQNLTPNLFTETIAGIIDSDERGRTMREAAKAFARPDAAKIIAQGIFDVAQHGNSPHTY